VYEGHEKTLPPMVANIVKSWSYLGAFSLKLPAFIQVKPFEAW